MVGCFLLLFWILVIETTASHKFWISQQIPLINANAQQDVFLFATLNKVDSLLVSDIKAPVMKKTQEKKI